MSALLTASSPQAIAACIIQHYERYHTQFQQITARARHRFEQTDWLGIQQDARERLTLYRVEVHAAVEEIERGAGESVENRTAWQDVKQHYTQWLAQRDDYEIAETFYNSVFRKIGTNKSVDVDLMFVFSEFKSRKLRSDLLIYREYAVRPDDWREMLKLVLLDYSFEPPFEDLERDISHMMRYLKRYVWPSIRDQGLGEETARLQVLKTIFFRNKAAYLVGRVYVGHLLVPFAVPLLHGLNGIYVDTLLTEPRQLGIIFSFTRSYFMVHVDIPSEFVDFLSTLMPHKKISELYNSIGFNKHGKTELYRNFAAHLRQTSDKFVLAPGIKGMVMSVFTLPSYNIVFKLIKDNFDPPKNTTRAEVKDKYKLVSHHDRVGRMADTHEFEDFTFDKERFSRELLEELQQVAPSLLRISGDKVMIRHLYTERKMIPLNLYLNGATQKEAEEAITEYGNAIKQLAAANIFPGDMLLKNFGVTRNKRVIFYDYDEILFLTDCKFRKIPPPRNMQEVYAAEPWYSVGPNDVFPEEFTNFLVGDGRLRDMFVKLHGDLFDVKFWRDTQARIRSGEVIDVFPYRRRQRFVRQPLPSEE